MVLLQSAAISHMPPCSQLYFCYSLLAPAITFVQKRMSKLRAGNNKKLPFRMKKLSTIVAMPLKNEVNQS